MKLPDGTVKVLVEGTSRAKIAGFTNHADFYEAEVEHVLPTKPAPTKETEALARTVPFRSSTAM